LLGQVEFLGEESEGLPRVFDALLQYGRHGGRGGACTSACGADGSGCSSRVARDKFALHSLKVLWSSSAHVMGWEPLTLVPERMS
jgi:hypothetical protein